jgi:hypothetical protein
MEVTTGKLSNYVGQEKEGDSGKLDKYLCSVDRDLDNLWRLVNSLLVVENRTSDPSSPSTGRMWFRTDI